MDAYHAYLLRLWREGIQICPGAARCKIPHSGEQRGFASLEQLFAYILERIGEPPPPNR
jgi:hypothetical protein